MIKINKKAFQVGKIFIFILALLIMSFILFYSYRSIDQLLNQKDAVDFERFRLELNREIDRSARKLDVDYPLIQTPAHVKMVCFASLNNKPNPDDEVDIIDCGNRNNNLDRYMCNAWANGENIFILPKQEKFSFRNEFIALSQGQDVLCLSITGGELEMKLTGIGKKALIEVPEQD